MAVSKITEKQITDNGVVSAADVLTGSIPENKSVFDKLPRFIITVLNGLIDKFNDSESSKITDVRVNGVSKVTNNIANITVDSDVSDASENPISNKAAKAYADKLKWASAAVTVDDVLSDTSANPVQNKVVTNKFTEVDSAINSAASTAQNNLDSAKADLNQNISNLQNALNAEVTNRESAVTSLGDSVSENTTAINSLMSDVGSHTSKISSITSEISSIQNQISFNSSENLEKLLAGTNLDSSVFYVNSGKYFRFGRVYAASLNVTVNIEEGKAYNIGNMGSRFGILSSDTIVGDIIPSGNCWVRALKTVTNKTIDVGIVFIR